MILNLMRKKTSLLIAGLILAIVPMVAVPSVAQADGCEAIDRSISHYETQIPKFPRYCSMVEITRRILNILFALIAMVSMIFIIVGGYQYMTARGNEEQATKGRQTLVYALLGFIVVILSVTIINIIINLVLFGKTF